MPRDRSAGRSGSPLPSRHLVDPELAPLIEVIEPAEYTLDDLVEIRRTTAHRIDRYLASLPLPEVDAHERHIPGPDEAPPVKIVITRPRRAAPPMPVLVWMHGGGYVVGGPRDPDFRIRPLVDAVGCTVVSVDYRLAPETRFPGALEDCYAAARWSHRHAEQLGADPAGVVVCGESAGGGLAAALALYARDLGELPILGQLLIYPMLDDRTVSRARQPFSGDYLWTPSANRFGWTSYLGREPGSAGVSPYAAPARAESLAGLPAAFIAVGALDLFLDENMEYAHRLIRAGVSTGLRVYRGAYHGFDLMTEARVAELLRNDLLHAFQSVIAFGHPGGADR